MRFVAHFGQFVKIKFTSFNFIKIFGDGIFISGIFLLVFLWLSLVIILYCLYSLPKSSIPYFPF